jgi:hypothetical protein
MVENDKKDLSVAWHLIRCYLEAMPTHRATIPHYVIDSKKT